MIEVRCVTATGLKAVYLRQTGPAEPVRALTEIEQQQELGFVDAPGAAASDAVLTSATGAKADTISDTGATTSQCSPCVS